MKPRDSAVRLKRFDVAEKARKVEDLGAMLREFDGMVHDLDRQIAAEEDRTGIKDRSHFAYSTFAKSAGQRRDNLLASIADLRNQLEAATRLHTEAVEELSRVEAVEPRETLERGRPRHERNLVQI